MADIYLTGPTGSTNTAHCDLCAPEPASRKRKHYTLHVIRRLASGKGDERIVRLCPDHARELRNATRGTVT